MRIKIILLILSLLVIVGVGFYFLSQPSYIESKTGMTREEFNNFQYRQAVELQQTGKADNGRTILIKRNEVLK